MRQTKHGVLHKFFQLNFCGHHGSVSFAFQEDVRISGEGSSVVIQTAGSNIFFQALRARVDNTAAIL